MNVNRRKRRTAEEAKALVLDTAARRLQEFGLEGLNIVGLAEEAGMSHATLIHHFGSSGGMRRALVERMTERLVRDAVATLANNQGLEGLFRELFSVFSTGGHAKLLAWLAIEEGSREPTSESMQTLFTGLVTACAEQLPDGNVDVARNIITLVVSAAIGLGVAGTELSSLVGLDDAAQEDFPRWLAAWIDADQLLS
jgi:AcrR family transcriptional regulator